MPVLVTGPGSTLGLEVVRVLAAAGGEVRAFCDVTDIVQSLRGLGVFCAVGSLLDEGHLETAMEQVHTLVHLPVGPLAADSDLVVDQAATVVAAAVGARVRRIVCLSVPAPAFAADPLRRAAAEVELLLSEAPACTTAVRASLVDTPELRAALARTPLGHDALDCLIAPVRPVDVAKLIGWLDDRRDLQAGHRVVAADGPQVVSLRTHLRELGITPLSAVGRVVQRLRPGTAPLLGEAFANPWTSGTEVDSGWAASGITPRSPLEATTP
ncbi:MAG: NmrA family NAD(P)-binding protein [Actinomycetota bacterium]|nr:NmrA family NAD(P)-binding protein [Actinomycetota bacterium]